MFTFLTDDITNQPNTINLRKCQNFDRNHKQTMTTLLPQFTETSVVSLREVTLPVDPMRVSDNRVFFGV